MANTARKARKRSGEKLVRIAKVGTPIEDRIIPTVVKKGILGPYEGVSNRRYKKAAKAIEIRDIDREVPVEVKSKRKAALAK